MKNIAFVVGHTATHKGAYSNELQLHEYDFWKQIYEDYLSEFGDLFVHTINSYTDRQRAMSERTRDYKLVIELHFDMYDSKAEGSHCIYYGKNKKTKKISKLLSDLTFEFFGIKKRDNLAIRNAETRGAGFVMLQKTDAILFEMFFGDNKSDVEKFQANKEKLRLVFEKVSKIV